jgi:hypothetical protein
MALSTGITVGGAGLRVVNNVAAAPDCRARLRQNTAAIATINRPPNSR